MNDYVVWLNRLGIFLGMISFIFLTPQLLGEEYLNRAEAYLEKFVRLINSILNYIRLKAPFLFIEDSTDKKSNQESSPEEKMVAESPGNQDSPVSKSEISVTPKTEPLARKILKSIWGMRGSLIIFGLLSIIVFWQIGPKSFSLLNILYTFILLASTLIFSILAGFIITFSFAMFRPEKNIPCALLILLPFVLISICLFITLSSRSSLASIVILFCSPILWGIVFLDILGVTAYLFTKLARSIEKMLKVLADDSHIRERWAVVGIILFFIGSFLQLVSTF